MAFTYWVFAKPRTDQIVKVLDNNVAALRSKVIIFDEWIFLTPMNGPVAAIFCTHIKNIFAISSQDIWVFFFQISNQNDFHMVKFFALFLNLGPNGSHSIKGASAVPVEHQKQGVDPFEENIVQNVWSLICCGIPQMYVTLKMLFFGALLVGLNVPDFFNDSISLLTRYLVLWRVLMLVRVNEWTFTWFYLLFLRTYILRPTITAWFGRSTLSRTLSTAKSFEIFWFKFDSWTWKQIYCVLKFI